MKRGVVDVVAGMTGIPKDELVGDDIAQQRHRRSWIRAVVAGLAVLTVLSLAVTYVAVVQYRAAVASQNLAIARQLVAQAESTLGDDPRTALRLNEAALQISPGRETTGSLIRDLLSTRYESTIDKGTGSVYSVAFSPRGHILATGAASQDSSVILWDVSDPARVTRSLVPEHTDWARALAFSPDGRILASGHDDAKVFLWDVSDPTAPHRMGDALLGLTNTVRAVAFSPDGHTVAAASEDHSVILWDVTDPGHARQRGAPLSTHTEGVRAIAFSPDGRTLATAGSGKGAPLTLWDVSKPDLPREIGVPLTGVGDDVFAMAFSPDSHTLATADYGHAAPLVLWDVSDPGRPRQLARPLTTFGDTVYSLAFAPNGRTLAVAGGSSAGYADSSVTLWNVADPTEPTPVGNPLTRSNERVRAIAFSADGNTLATSREGPGDIGHGAGIDSSVILWDVSNPGRPGVLGNPKTDGRVPAADDTGSAVFSWDVSDPDQPRHVDTPVTRTPAEARGVALSTDGRTLAVGAPLGNSGAATLWDVSNPSEPRRLGKPLIGDSGKTPHVAFAPGGDLLATTDAGEEVASKVLLWDLSDRADPHRIGDPLAIAATPVEVAAFSPRGHLLATTAAWKYDTSEDQSAVALWDVSDPARPFLINTLPTGDTKSSDPSGFSPDGQTLTARRGDGSAVTWDLRAVNALLDDPLGQACTLTGHGLDETQWARYISGAPYQESCSTAVATATEPPVASAASDPPSASAPFTATDPPTAASARPDAPTVADDPPTRPDAAATATVASIGGTGAEYVVTRTTGPYDGSAAYGQSGAPDDSEADVVQCRSGDLALHGTATIDPRTPAGLSPVVLRIGENGVTYSGDAGLWEFYAFVETTGKVGWNSVTLTVTCQKR